MSETKIDAMLAEVPAELRPSVERLLRRLATVSREKLTEVARALLAGSVDEAHRALIAAMSQEELLAEIEHWVQRVRETTRRENAERDELAAIMEQIVVTALKLLAARVGV